MRISNAEAERLEAYIKKIALETPEGSPCITEWDGAMHAGRPVFSGVAVLRRVLAIRLDLDVKSSAFKNGYKAKLTCGNPKCFSPHCIEAIKIEKPTPLRERQKEPDIANALSRAWISKEAQG